MLSDEGHNKSQISKMLSIPRTTIRDMLNCDPKADRSLISLENLSELQQQAYAYIFGQYLGDGNIVHVGRSYSLRISADIKYPGIIKECMDNLSCIFKNNSVSQTLRYNKGKPSWFVISTHNNNIPMLFPQHGVGPKYFRKIEATSLQTDIINKYAKEFVRGLYHSDGSRYLINEGNFAYSFTNVSEDISNLYKKYLITLNIHFTSCVRKPQKEGYQPVHVTYVYSKNFVNKLDKFLGPKY